MKKTLLLTVLCVHQYAFAQSNADLKIIDLSQTELRLLNKGKELDSITRSKIYLDSLYMPYKQFWSGYAGKEKDFLSWMNKEGVVFLDYLNQRNKDINGGKLLAQFNEVEDSMIKLTGYTPKGTWYIVYYHGSTNLGGLGSGEMLIDLSHENNSSNENIMAFFPHELAHQIMSNINKHKDSTAISWIIGEGLLFT